MRKRPLLGIFLTLSFTCLLLYLRGAPPPILVNLGAHSTKGNVLTRTQDLREQFEEIPTEDEEIKRLRGIPLTISGSEHKQTGTKDGSVLNGMEWHLGTGSRIGISDSKVIKGIGMEQSGSNSTAGFQVTAGVLTVGGVPAMEQKAGSPRVFAVFSSDDRDAQYLSTAPFTAYVWKKHLDVTPIMFFCETGKNVEAAKIVKNIILEELQGKVIEFCPTNPKNLVATTLQVGRLAAFALDFVKDNDVLITADADIWPLDPLFWKHEIELFKSDPILDENGPEFFVFNGPFYYEQSSRGSDDRFAISFLMARVSKWRELYIKTFPLSVELLREKLDIYRVTRDMLDLGEQHKGSNIWNGHTENIKHGDQWNWDQVLIGILLFNANLCPSVRCRINPTVIRLDRMNWVLHRDPILYTDAHLIFPFTNDEIWKNVAPVWERLFHDEGIKDAERIRAILKRAIL